MAVLVAVEDLAVSAAVVSAAVAPGGGDLRELSATSVERGRYNDAVRAYNTQVLQFPTNMVAGMFGFSDREYFEADEAAVQVPQVTFQ